MAMHVLAMQPATGDPSLLTTAQEFRNNLTGLLAAPGGNEGVQGVTGITAPSAGAAAGGFAVTQRAAGANFSVDVAAGHCYVTGSDVTSQGAYHVWNDTAVNVITPTATGYTGTRTHRLIVQIQDKLANGTWAGYQAQLVLLPDTGTGTPAPGNSAITLALISITGNVDASVTNSKIADYRRAPGGISVVKTADATPRTATAMTSDPDLQLWGLANSAWYRFVGGLRLAGDVSRQFQGQWQLPSASVHVFFTRIGGNASGGNVTEWGFTDNDVFQCDIGTGPVITQQTLSGTIQTGGTAPNNNLILAWGANSSGTGTGATLKAGSFLDAWRVA